MREPADQAPQDGRAGGSNGRSVWEVPVIRTTIQVPLGPVTDEVDDDRE